MYQIKLILRKSFIARQLLFSHNIFNLLNTINYRKFYFFFLKILKSIVFKFRKHQNVKILKFSLLVSRRLISSITFYFLCCHVKCCIFVFEILIKSIDVIKQFKNRNLKSLNYTLLWWNSYLFSLVNVLTIVIFNCIEHKIFFQCWF